MKSHEGIVSLTLKEAELERRLFREMEDHLVEQNFNYLSIPSSISDAMLDLQGLVSSTLRVDDTHALTGSAEQGMLAYLKESSLGVGNYFALNQCWRSEDFYQGAKYCKEFKKLEMLSLCTQEDVDATFDMFVQNARYLFEVYGIPHRKVSVAPEGKEYHVRQIDIEVYTKEYGWLETHSILDYGQEHAKRFGFEDHIHTICGTGMASPRLLIPFIESWS